MEIMISDILSDWQKGVPRLQICLKYGITEHGYRLIDKEAKKQGLCRTSKLKSHVSSLVSSYVQEQKERKEKIDLIKKDTFKLETELELKKAQDKLKEAEDKLEKQRLEREAQKKKEDDEWRAKYGRGLHSPISSSSDSE